MTILPSPLHPLVVHMPIALTVLVPLFALGALWAIRRGARFQRALGLAVGMLALLLVSAWVALHGRSGHCLHRLASSQQVQDRDRAGWVG